MTSASGPNQPKKFAFPSRQFGRKGEKRSFKPAWFSDWPWLDYRELDDSVVCFYALLQMKRGCYLKVSSTKGRRPRVLAIGKTLVLDKY
jgi:hypothetical protein